MKWIGFNRNDPEQRQFEFDDTEVTNTEPKQYSVRFIDTNENVSIPCESVFKLKPVKPFKRKTQVQVNEPIEHPNEDVENQQEEMDEELQKEIEDELKPKWNKRQESIPDISLEETPKLQKKQSVRKKKNISTEAQIDVQTTEHKYEYKTILEDFENIDLLQESLNKLGDECWELINFEIVKSMFPNKSRLFCILKRNKQ
jgi:hypothetical protein